MACKGCAKKKAQREIVELSSKDIRKADMSADDKTIWNIERHLGSAIQQLYEVRCGYPHIPYAVGNLTRAMEHASEHKDLKDAISAIIKDIRDNINPDFDKAIAIVSAMSDKEAFIRFENKYSQFTPDGPTERKSFKTRPSCIECVEKHLGAAIVLLDDCTEHKQYILAVGHLTEAEQESQDFPEIEAMIYTARKEVQVRIGIKPGIPDSLYTAIDLISIQRTKEDA